MQFKTYTAFSLSTSWILGQSFLPCEATFNIYKNEMIFLKMVYICDANVKFISYIEGRVRGWFNHLIRERYCNKICELQISLRSSIGYIDTFIIIYTGQVKLEMKPFICYSNF